MNTCSIKGCETSIFEQGIKMYGIPKGNLGKEWIKQIKLFQQDFEPTKYSIICSKHFIESSYVDRINSILKSTSVPSLFKKSVSTNLLPTNNIDVIEVYLDNETCDLEFHSDVDTSEDNVKNDHNGPKIDTLALKTNEGFRNNAIQDLSQQTLTVAMASSTSEDPPKKVDVSSQLPTNHDDSESVKGKFGWENIGCCNVPYIIRIINNEKIRFVSVRIAEIQLLKTYLRTLSANLYADTHIKSYFLTDPEAKLLNSINEDHCDFLYGRDKFWAGKDILVQFEDLYDFYIFLDVCYAFVCKNPSFYRKFCGFMKMNSDFIFPYCIQDKKIYVPLFYFNNILTKVEEENVVIIKNWHCLYLKICFNIQNILYHNDYCRTVSLEYLKKCLPKNTKLRKVLVTSVENIVNLNCIEDESFCTDIWFRGPLRNDISRSVLPPYTLSVPHMVSPLDMPLVKSTHQNEQLSNQMGSVILQQNSDSLNNKGHILHTPFSIQVGIPSTSAVSAISSSNNVAITQRTINMCNTMSTSSTISNNDALQQLYESVATNSQKFYSSQLMSASEVNAFVTNAQQWNALKTVVPVTYISQSEVINLRFLPSNLSPPTNAQDLVNVNNVLQLSQLPNRCYTILEFHPFQHATHTFKCIQYVK